MDGEFKIGPWLVYPSLNVISQNGSTIHVEPKVMQVLVCLAQSAGELVSREELLETVWPGTFVTDDVLKRCVSELRRVFKDDSREPHIIETIPKRGYRLLAPIEKSVRSGHVSSALPMSGSIAEERAGPSEHRLRPPTKLLLQVTTTFLVLVLCGIVSYIRGKRSAALVPPSFQRLTFERGIIYSARFAPDNQIVYDASWSNRPVRIFVTHAGILQPMPLDLGSVHLLAISATGELALALNGYPQSHPVFVRGTLARAPMAGGAPRQLLEDVRWADWDRNGELALVHHLNDRSRLEYPVGRVLYESQGWISHIRLSPRNDRIAFVDHPMWDDDGGSVVVVGLKSQERKILSSGWESAQGLAWSPSGDEVWFTAARSGERRDLFAVDLHGRQRMLLQVPGGITLQDISPDGRILLIVDNERSGTIALSPSGEHDLSWLDINFPLAVSADGNQVLLAEQSELAGADYYLGLRSLDGSSYVRLGEGVGGNFSPDGKWTATAINSTPESTFLLPVGAGERKELRHPEVRTYGPTWFMADGKSVMFTGIESGHSSRMYIQSLQGGPARPLTPEGVLARCPSPDGQYLVARPADQTPVIYDLRVREFRAITGATAQMWPIGWSPDSRFLYMYTRTAPPSQIWRFDISSGQEKPIRQVTPADPAGILEIFQVKMTPDARTFVYGYDRYLSELYVVKGLR